MSKSREELLAENRALRAELAALRGVQSADAPSGSSLPYPMDVLGLLNALPMLVGYADREQRCRFANAAYREWFDLPEPPVGRSAREILGPDAYATARPYIERALRGETVEYELILMGKSGRTRVGLARYVPHVDDERTVLGFYVLVSDITRRAARALRESEARFRGTFENAAVGMAHVDIDGKWLRVNQQLCEMVGYSREELLSLTFQDITHPDDLQPSLERIGLLMSGEIDTYSLEKRYSHKQGHIIWAHLTAAVQRGDDGNPLYCIAVIQDITQRKMAELALRARERALRESEERFRQLADAMPQIVWAARADGYIDYYNQRWYELTGMSEGEIGNESWGPFLHPDDVESCFESWYESVRSGELYQCEYRFWDRVRQRHRWYLGRALPVRNEEGAIVRWYGTCTDIDDQKRAEEHLAASDRRKDDFLAMLGHELRNPIAPVLNGVQLLRSMPLDRVQQRTVDIMDRQVQHMVRLLDDLLDVSRISRGKIQLKRERVELASLVQTGIDGQRPLMEQQGQMLDVSLERGPLVVDADPARMVQVVSNLLHNAAKYSAAGSRISIQLRREGNVAVIVVADDGVGIASAELPYIFDLFVQTERSLDRRQGGLGIGLTLVRRLVHKHGGTVYARSEGPGQGSEFVVRLPLADSAPCVVAARAEEPGAQEPDAPRILVVDDNQDAAVLLATAMEAEGHPVHVSLDGRAALDAFEQFEPHVVLLDIGLPGLDGYEVARRIRAAPRGARVMLVAVTGYGQQKDVSRARCAGFDHHLLKPVDLDSLRALIESSGVR